MIVRILKYAGLALLVQLIFLAAFIFLMVELEVKDPGTIGMAIIMLYIWLLFFLPPGHGHGGELLFAPVTAVFYSLVFGQIMTMLKKPRAWKRKRSWDG